MKITVENRKLTVSGEGVDYVEIEGVLYTYELFRTLGFPRTDRLFQFERKDNVLIVTDRGPAPPPEKFDA
jgi:hypothetical protein